MIRRCLRVARRNAASFISACRHCRWLGVLAALLLWPCSANHAAPAAAAGLPVVMVFGDSLSAAYGLQQNAGWVHLLGERLKQQRRPYAVVNASISGETTRGGLTRIESALRQYRPAVVIVELGANDGLRGLALTDTQANLDAIVSRSQATKAKVLIVGIELPPNYGAAYLQRFANVFHETARRRQTPLVPTLLAGFGERRELFQADGLHPTAEAQPIILETVWRELKPLL